MAKDKRTRDQKRKAKLAKERQQAGKSNSLAYMGDKYKTQKLMHTLMNTEIGIYESYVMTDRKLLDQTVRAALEALIKKMQAGTLPPLSDIAEVDYEVGQEEDLVIANIRRNWARHFATEWRPPKDERIGVLRTILGSIEMMRSPGPRSQSYLHQIAGFITKKMGASVKAFSGDMIPIPEAEEDELLLLGRQCTSGDKETAKDEFRGLASDLMTSGQAQRVLNSCHHLLGEEPDAEPEFLAELIELIELIQTARQSLMAAIN